CAVSPRAGPRHFAIHLEPRWETWRDRCRFDLDRRLAELRPTPVAPQVLRNFANMCRRTAR
ncbi:MAG: hypothetical protein N3A53_03075, partial [Verrucomicrobiae bacterium]|nr:hypothetical protein [Verrucomicrobiae bacterium]